MSVPRRSWYRSKLLTVHALFLALLMLYLAFALIVDSNTQYNPEDGPIIGGPSIYTLPLMPFGLPWSAALLALDADGAIVVVGFGSALLNLALHAGFRVYRSRRELSPPEEQ